jgi:hypothetical protein
LCIATISHDPLGNRQTCQSFVNKFVNDGEQ